jgi:HK97 gp10 family phage protein
MDAAGLGRQIEERISRLNAERLERLARGAAELVQQEWRATEIAHNRTGHYRTSIQVRTVEATAERATVETGTDDPAAVYLEYGTSHQSARPVMRPAYDAAKGPGARQMADGVAAALGAK